MDKASSLHKCVDCTRSYTEWGNLKRHSLTAHNTILNRLGKRKIRNVESWERNVQKRRRAEGKSYIQNSKQGKVLVPEKRFVYIAQCCAKNCYKAISNDKQIELFKNFYSLANKVEQDRYLSRFIVSQEIKRRRTQVVTKYRGNMWEYSVTIKGANCRVVVCRQLFLQLFQVTERRVKTVTAKILKGIMDFEDKRGSHINRPNKIPTEVWAHVNEHLVSLLPRRTVQECCNNSIHKLDCYKPPFTVAKFFDLFQEYFKERTNTKLKMKYSTYRKYLSENHYLKQFMPLEQNIKHNPDLCKNIQEDQPCVVIASEEVVGYSSQENFLEAPLVQEVALEEQEPVLEEECLVNLQNIVFEEVTLKLEEESIVEENTLLDDVTEIGMECKRKISDVESWERNVQKKRRAEGKFYIKHSKQGKLIVPEKQFVYIAQCCARNCYKAISNDQQIELFKNFYSLASKVEQDRYLSRCIVSQEIKHRRTQVVTKYRGNMWEYSVTVKGANCRVVVCRQLFLQLFQVTERRVRTVTAKIFKGIMDFEDKRGSHINRPNKIPTEVWAHVNEHLVSLLPRRTDQECCNNSIHMLDCYKPSFTVAKLFALFQEYFKERTNTKLKMKYNTYYKYLCKNPDLKQFMHIKQNRQHTPDFSQYIKDDEPFILIVSDDVAFSPKEYFF